MKMEERDIIGIPVSKYSRILIFKDGALMKKTVDINPHIEEVAGINEKLSGVFIAGIKSLDNEEQKP